MCLRHIDHNIARAITIIKYSQQTFDLLDRKTKITAPLDEGQAFQITFLVVPTAIHRSFCDWYKTNLFVIPDGRHVATSQGSHLTDGILRCLHDYISK